MADDNDNTDSGRRGHGQAGGGDEAGGPGDGATPESLLPYDAWTELALRQVVVTALTHVAEHGLPGEHHFYLTFRTDQPGVSIPPRLRAQYAHEMTIVLQHQFWGLSVDPATSTVTVGLSFGGVPSTLIIPLAAVTGFADPHVRYGLRFKPVEPEKAAPALLPGPVHRDVVEAEPRNPNEPAPDPTPQVVSLDAFRRRAPPKDSA